MIPPSIGITQSSPPGLCILSSQLQSKALALPITYARKISNYFPFQKPFPAYIENLNGLLTIKAGFKSKPSITTSLLSIPPTNEPSSIHIIPFSISPLMAAFQSLHGKYNSRIFTMRGRLGANIIVPALIDTGASVCVIAEQTVLAAKIPFIPMALDSFGFAVMTANGSSLGLLGRIPGQTPFSLCSTLGHTMNFNFDDSIRDTTLFVCRNLPTDIIISLMFLSHYDISIRPRARELSWQGHVFNSSSCEPSNSSSTTDIVNPPLMLAPIQPSSEKWSCSRTLTGSPILSQFSILP